MGSIHPVPSKVAESSTTSVGTSNVQLFAANAGRMGLEITNTHGSQILYVRIGTTAATSAIGRPIAAGATLKYPEVAGGPCPAEAIQIIANGASTGVYAIEHTGQLVG